MKRMYQIYDLEAGLVHGPIFLEHNDKPAARNFRTIFTHEGSMPNKFPEQFELRCLGVQDDETGHIEVHHPYIVVDSGQHWAADQIKQHQIEIAKEAFANKER